MPGAGLVPLDDVLAYLTANKLLMNKIELENLVEHYGMDGMVDFQAFLLALQTDDSGEDPLYHTMYSPASINEAHLALSGTSHIDFAVQAKPFPKHWGVPPNAQMKGHDGIMRDLPGDYGRGNAPMAKWVQANLQKDAKSTTNVRGGKPYPFGNYSL